MNGDTQETLNPLASVQHSLIQAGTQWWNSGGSQEDGKPTVFPLESLQSRLSIVQERGWLVVMCHVPTPREDNFLLPVAPEVHLKVLPGISCICHLNVGSLGVWGFFLL